MKEITFNEAMAMPYHKKECAGIRRKTL